MKNSPSNQLKASALVSVIAFFAVFFVFCGFAIDFSMVVASRAQLQTAVETAALASAAEVPALNAQTTARKVFSYSQTNSLKNSHITNVEVKNAANAILVEAYAPAQTYFLSALGINNIEIQARAAAQIEPIVLNSDADFDVVNHLQFSSPSLILAKEGAEIKITRDDTTSEYLVYAGLNDKINETKWVEITCSSADLTAKEQYFDFDAQCIKDKYNGGISAAQYIRIINNNSSTPLLINELALNNAVKLIKYSQFRAL